MKSLIMRSHHESYDSLFAQAAMNHSLKMTFTTREEYLLWVKQWKEDYNRYVFEGQLSDVEWKLSMANNSDKIKRLTEKVASMKAKQKSIDGEYLKRIETYKKELVDIYGFFSWQLYYPSIIQYLLVMRKASKLRANIQRNIRLLNKS